MYKLKKKMVRFLLCPYIRPFMSLLVCYSCVVLESIRDNMSACVDFRVPLPPPKLPALVPGKIQEKKVKTQKEIKAEEEQKEKESYRMKKMKLQDERELVCYLIGLTCWCLLSLSRMRVGVGGGRGWLMVSRQCQPTMSPETCFKSDLVHV